MGFKKLGRSNFHKISEAELICAKYKDEKKKKIELSYEKIVKSLFDLK